MKCKYICRETRDPEIFRLRYKVYVDEKHYVEENSVRDSSQIVEDELDKKAHIFGVYFGDRLIASARYNCTVSGDKLEALNMFPEYYGYLEKKTHISREYLSLIEISRIVVDESYRNTYAIPILFFEIFEHAVINYNIDGMVYKIRESEESLKNLYLNFKCKVIEDSVKEIKPYENKTDVLFLFGYMLLNELDLNFSHQKIYRVLEHVGGRKYIDRIKKLEQIIRNQKIKNA